MKICICNNISDKEIKELLSNKKTIEQILEITQVGSDCGVCLKDAIRRMKDGFSESKT